QIGFGPDQFGHVAGAFFYEDIDIQGLPDTFTVIQFADDESVPVNLGSNTFTFYGTTYTGATSLFASSNGLITFGSANAEFNNTDLTTVPNQAAIAVLWDDWIKLSGSPMLLGRFEDIDGDGLIDRLVLQWNEVQHFGVATRGITFQALLYLNS